MEQRAAMVRAFVASPQLLLLAEPYTGMEVGASALWDQWIRDTPAAGGAVLLITHQLDEAVRMGDRLRILWRGRLEGPPMTREEPARFGEPLTRTYEVRVSRSGPIGA